MQIHIEAPGQQTFIFIIILITFILFSFRKIKGESQFDINITNELKGLAILMVIFSHMGYFLSDNNLFLYPLSIGGGIGVNLFFFLSAYGLSVSAFSKGCSIINFYKQRVTRLIIPLWIVLMLILFSDYLILSRIYNISEILHSFLGYFPISDLSSSINSPLWFITPIIFYYLIFPLIFNKKYLYISGILLAFFSYILLFNSQIGNFLVSNKILNKDLLNLYQIHFAAFPLGLVVADLIFNKKLFKNVRFNLFVQGLLVFCALIIICYFSINSFVGIDKIKEQFISLIISLLLVFVFIYKNIKITLFSLFGIYSYEIYLIHWPIISRFDIFFNRFPAFLAVCFYLILFLIAGIALQKISNIIARRL